MPRAKLHLAGPQSGPLCNRQLARQGTAPEAHLYVQGTAPMLLTQQPSEVTCRHCLRALGLLPPIGRRAYEPDENDRAMSDDELLAALVDGDDMEELLDMVEGRDE